MSDNVLAKLDKCKFLLSQCKSVEQAKRLSALADAARVYAKRVGASLYVVNQAVEYKVRAERRLGEILGRNEKANGGHAQRTRYRKGTESPSTLSQLGLTKKVSSRAQKLAAIPSEVFERKLKEAGEESRELTTVAVLRDTTREIVHAARGFVLPPKGKYRVIYADPPWSYGNTGLDDYGHAERHYPSMTIEQLCALDVKAISGDQSVLFIWVTSPLLEECFSVINAWGFKYKASFVWDKVKHNFGHYNSVRHEFLLICVRGSCAPESKKLHDSVQSIERSPKHSEKPGEFRALIEEMYPTGPKIELFARGKNLGWETWGNETS